MDVMIALIQLQEEAERQMRDADSVGDKEWSAAYRGQAYAFKVARHLVRKMMIEKTDDTLSVIEPKMTISGSHS